MGPIVRTIQFGSANKQLLQSDCVKKSFAAKCFDTGFLLDYDCVFMIGFKYQKYLSFSYLQVWRDFWHFFFQFWDIF